MDPTPTLLEQQQEEISRLREELRRIKHHGGARAPPPSAAFQQNTTPPPPPTSHTSHTSHTLPYLSDVYETDTVDSPPQSTPTHDSHASQEAMEEHRLQLQSKNETITLVQEALEAARETTEALEGELAALHDALRAQRKRGGGHDDEARAHLRALVREAVADRQRLEEETRAAEVQAKEEEADFATQKEALKKEVEAAAAAVAREREAERLRGEAVLEAEKQQQQQQQQLQATAQGTLDASDSVGLSFSDDGAAFHERLANDKRDMLMSLEDEKQHLLDDFHIMRSRLRAKISLLEKNGESKQRQLEEIHVAKSELESKLIHARENQQRLFEQFKSRLDTQHGQLVRAKTRETKARRLLDEKCTECDDLKLSLHDSLGLGGTQQQRRVGAGGTPQRSSKVPFR